MSWALTALQFVLAGTLILAAVAKFFQADEFVAALRLSHVPEPAVPLLAVAVPVVEVLLGCGLLLAAPRQLGWAFAAVAALFAAFTFWMTWVRARGLHVRCGCFGPNGGQVGQRTILRNLGLLALAVAGMVIAEKSAPVLYDASLWWVLTVVAAVLVITMVAAVRFVLPHLTLSEASLRTGSGQE